MALPPGNLNAGRCPQTSGLPRGAQNQVALSAITGGIFNGPQVGWSCTGPGVSLVRWAMNSGGTPLLSVRAEARQLVAPDYAELDGQIEHTAGSKRRRCGRSPAAWIS